MTYSTPNKSVVIPEISTPKASPKSIHNRKVPMLSALCMGQVTCAIIDRKVGETKVVPKPKKEETPTNKYNSLQKGRIKKTCFVNSIF